MLRELVFSPSAPPCRWFLSFCCLVIYVLIAACGGVRSVPSRAAGSGGIPSYDRSAPGVNAIAAPTQNPYSGSSGQGRMRSDSGMPPHADSIPPAADTSVYATSVSTPAMPASEHGVPAVGRQAESFAPVWRVLAQRLAADGFSGPQVDALLASLAATPTQSPMGRKMRELYTRRFFPRPPSATPPPLYYKGVITEANAQTCRQFIAANRGAFSRAETQYGVPSSIAVSLLFVETRLGKVLADVPENAFYTLASMAISRQPSDIPNWLGRMPGYEEHLDWFSETMPKRSDWAYKEVRALVAYMLRDGIDPRNLPSSIYGAVGLCQFMPSNISTYGADGDEDGRVDLFSIPDAVASLSNYLAKHGWKPGLSRLRQHQLLMTYNHAAIYANTILALSDMVSGIPAPAAPQADKKLKVKTRAAKQSRSIER